MGSEVDKRRQFIDIFDLPDHNIKAWLDEMKGQWRDLVKLGPRSQRRVCFYSRGPHDRCLVHWQSVALQGDDHAGSR